MIISFALGTFSDLRMHWLKILALNFSDLTLRYCILKIYMTEEPKFPSQTNDCFPEFCKIL
jgi:hypothetical protein